MTATVAGATVGSYRILGELGEGGMGVVYLAEHNLIGRRAAVKMLLPRHSNDAQAVNRFFNEARASSRIRHPGIVDVLDFGVAGDGRAFIVMELLEGVTLGSMIKSSAPLLEGDIVRYSRQIASALDAAHGAQIIHRDLKPDNIFVTAAPDVVGGERLKLLDFGIAKLTEGPGSTSRTATGQVMGSPLYMSPEQCAGAGGVDTRTDVYSLGCVMFEMATGRPPFESGGVGAVLSMHIYEQPTPPRALNPEISAPLDGLILSLLAKRPEGRPPTMRAVIDQLDALSAGVFRQTAPTRRDGPTGPPPFEESARFAPTIAASGVATTTHGSASGQVTAARPAGRGRLWITAALASAVLAGAIVAITATARSPESEATTAADPVDEPIQPAAIEPDATAAVEPPTPVVTLAITSEPTALVRDRDRQLLGETPYSLEIEQGEEPVELIVGQLGYDEAHVSLVPSEDRTEHVVLVSAGSEKKSRSRRRRPGKSDGAKTGKKQPQPQPPKKKKKGGFGETIDPLGGD
jgi:serine/threonine-protein kinase